MKCLCLMLYKQFAQIKLLSWLISFFIFKEQKNLQKKNKYILLNIYLYIYIYISII
jgi:hypothetical protein